MNHHPFDAGYTGLSTTCNALIMRDGAGADCGLPKEDSIHKITALVAPDEYGVTMDLATGALKVYPPGADMDDPEAGRDWPAATG